MNEDTQVLSGSLERLALMAVCHWLKWRSIRLVQAILSSDKTFAGLL